MVLGGLIVAAAVLAAVLAARRITGDGPRTVMAAPEAPLPGPATAPPAPDHAPVAPSAPAAPAVAAVSDEPRPAVAAPAPAGSEPAQITLHLATDPPGAVVLLDGERVTGSELVVARDDTLHQLQVSSPGYGPYTGTVRFDANKHLSIQLWRNRLRKNPVKPEPPESPDPPERIYTESPYAPGSPKK
jgi:hypothetical protein